MSREKCMQWVTAKVPNKKIQQSTSVFWERFIDLWTNNIFANYRQVDADSMLQRGQKARIWHAATVNLASSRIMCQLIHPYCSKAIITYLLSIWDRISRRYICCVVFRIWTRNVEQRNVERVDLEQVSWIKHRRKQKNKKTTKIYFKSPSLKKIRKKKKQITNEKKKGIPYKKCKCVGIDMKKHFNTFSFW